MRLMKPAPLPLILLVMLCPSFARAQYRVPHGVQGSGGGTASGSHFVWFTIGETQIGYTTGPANTVLAGFWQIAALSSRVEVAISSFSGLVSNGAVVLKWTAAASGSLDGFNLYRGEGADPAGFARLNDEPFGAPGENVYLDETALPGRTYTYQVGGVQGDREFLSFTIAVAIPSIPLTLYQNYPNPFNPSTAISFYLPGPDHARLEIFNVAGRLIRTLADGRFDGGRHTVRWNGKNEAGSPVSSGIYLCRLVCGKKTLTRKLALMR